MHIAYRTPSLITFESNMDSSTFSSHQFGDSVRMTIREPFIAIEAKQSIYPPAYEKRHIQSE
jgi:hypothetical protein